MDRKVGIIGGGQLGKMILDEASKIGLSLSILDPSNESPCCKLSNNFVQGDFNDYNTVINFGEKHDLISYEIEHINIDALDTLVKNGVEVQPTPKILRMIQDKNLQKSFFKKNNFPTSNFTSVSISTQQPFRIYFTCILNSICVPGSPLRDKLLINAIQRTEIISVPHTEPYTTVKQIFWSVLGLH